MSGRTSDRPQGERRMSRTIELPSWVTAAVDVFFYVLVVPGLAAYAIFGLALVISPVVFAFWGKAPLVDRIWAGLSLCLIVAFAALKLL